MKQRDKKTDDGNSGKKDEDTDFIRKFITRKKLQNKVLGEIIDKMSKDIEITIPPKSGKRSTPKSGTNH